MEIDKRTLEVGDRVWACAYDYYYNRTEKALIQEPVFGEIVYNKKSWSTLGFAIIGKNGKPRTSGIVSLEARTFAKTEEECKELYNEKIKDRIKMLENDINNMKKDLI